MILPQRQLCADAMKILGIDIGTTTITALVTDTESRKTISCKTLPNDSFVKGKDFEKIQSPEKILSIVKEAVKAVTEGLVPDAIGVTGQMHGILYVNEDYKPCSDLYIWQDARGNLPYKDGLSYAEYLTRLTGIKAASGFGLTTHFYNLVNKLVPEKAIMLCTIHDYIVSVLTSTMPVTHSSDAASLGFYDLNKHSFDDRALFLAGIDPLFLPDVFTNTAIAGTTDCDFLPDGIPVALAIGDNQGSFLGSVSDYNSQVLVNVGTGSQVSFVTDSTTTPVGEIRPLTDDKYIFVGASLCGGRAYAILKNFFALCADMLGGSAESLYPLMDKLSENIFSINDELTVNCGFCGTRDNPDERGSITNISDSNFTPEKLICGFLKGVSAELKEMYDNAQFLLRFTPESLVCSGNGLRKSHIWRKVFEKDFSLPCELPLFSEEAATGACVFAAAASGIYKNIQEAQNSLLR